jgi:ribonuclease P protein component
MRPDEGAKFPKQARLRKRPEFLRVSHAGRKLRSSHFVIISESNEREETRLGVTVSAKVGNSVVRNRIKRLLREFFRRHRHKIAPNQDVLIIARKGAGDLSWRDVVDEIGEKLIRKGNRRKL